ncbi:RagB/SusD family nutrient uptake outer membrane protein [Phnomibacter ginsenosidimutans]|uniref:RagB/SusD family nutrient uptake outer membrane protein n=1 Tax=Phnomibacter ginsenosidimutans TaxID=2676868 RepID=A0A6I6GW26_9BACT|nr:RagB/SusD family nutrient uptake outer membrane protein [Phnomibacter ginsenosidimutans]QGW26831.1 RagB/SusD family nutrient uptake outer membrane protein [Phnomibacter ginsenosidimutans]
MKQRIQKGSYLVVVLAMGLLLGACNKFLDRKPLSATLEDLNQGGLEGQIYGLYGAIRNGDIAGQGFGGIPWLGIQNFRSDDSEKGSSASDGADWGVIYDQFQYVKDHWSNTVYWDHHYTLIGAANTALQIADSLQLNDPASQINRAEARFFRAFAYFDLVRTFGEVPKIDFRVYSATDAQRPKAPIAEIYALIDADLQFAAANLPLNWKNAAGSSRFPGRLTKGAAQALHAKTYLARSNWAQGLTLAQAVINSGEYALTSSFAGIWTTAGENNSESIFEIQASIGANNADNYSAPNAVHQGVRGSGDWDLGWGWNTPTQELVDAFETGDPRKNATILFSGQPDGLYGKVLPDFPTIPRKYWNKKVYPEPSQQTFTGNRQGGWINQRVLRFADVLLLAAEAANETGNGALAETYLERVRSRARAGDNAILPKVVFQSQAQMRNAIRQERRVELALEGDRFFDLVRWGIATNVLGSAGYTNKHRFYPIPQQAIDNSGGKLVQNPEWQ